MLVSLAGEFKPQEARKDSPRPWGEGTEKTKAVQDAGRRMPCKLNASTVFKEDMLLPVLGSLEGGLSSAFPDSRGTVVGTERWQEGSEMCHRFPEHLRGTPYV